MSPGMSPEVSTGTSVGATTPNGMNPKLKPVLVFAWLWVASPFTYGLYKLFQKIDALFS
jgi:hypothetical protein